MLYIQLSKNFRSEEFECKCCGKCEMDQRLIDVLQLIRDILNKPIYINSGYRCDKHNKEVGGSSNSQHTKGKAADIRIKDMSVKQMYEMVKCFPTITGIGIYPEQHFVHVDVRDKPSTWVYIKSKRKYITVDEFEKLLESDHLLRYDYTTIRP